MKKTAVRTVIEVMFILMLFYCNLLMGEFTGTGQGTKNGLIWALGNIFTASNFAIGLIAAFAAHLIFEYFRNRL